MSTQLNLATPQTHLPIPPRRKVRPLLTRTPDTIDDDVLAAICVGQSDWWGLVRVAGSEDALGSSLRRLMLEQQLVGCRAVPGEYDRHGCEQRRYYIKEML